MGAKNLVSVSRRENRFRRSGRGIANPKVTVSAGKSPQVHFDASVLPSGSSIGLPHETEVFAKGAWKSADQLKVEIEGDGATIQGIVSVSKLGQAIAYCVPIAPHKGGSNSKKVKMLPYRNITRAYAPGANPEPPNFSSNVCDAGRLIRPKRNDRP